MESTFKDRLAVLIDEEFDGNQTRAAARLGVSKQAISTWISGERSPKPPTIQSIAAAFDVCVPWLMGLDTPREPYSAYASGLHLSAEEKALVLAYREAEPSAQTIAVEILLAHKKKDAIALMAT